MSIRIKVQVEGDRELRAALRRLGPAGVPAAKRVFARFTGRVVPRARSLAPVEPEDGGALRDSVRETRPTLTSKGVVSVAVVAGGTPLAGKVAATHHTYNVYATVQHEDLTLKHSHGQAKFVEIPVMQEAPLVPNELLEELDREARKA